MDINTAYSHIAILSFVYVIAWSYILTLKEFLIDDDFGIKPFSDRFVQHKDPQGNIVKEELVDWYEHDDNGKKTVFKNNQFNPLIGMPGAVIRWLRILWGRKWAVLGKNSKGHEVYGYVQSVTKHHLLSFLVHYANILLSYTFLKSLLGEDLAFYSTLLFSIHPITAMAVAWISGIGYLTSLLFALISFNLPQLLSGSPLIYSTLLATYMSCAGLLAGFANWLILLLIGHKESALSAFLVAVFMMATFGRSTVDYRKKQFSEQNMGKSTTFNWRKPIVIVKTMYYYFAMLVFPKRLGLFHKWGYHYDEKIERIDFMFFKGVFVLLALFYAIYAGPFAVKFGAIWLLAYLILFSNVITAQQFVVDRYAFISSLGFCIITAYYLSPYPALFWSLCGVYIMRIWCHLPSFNDQVSFYESNVRNFPDSEVAYGNLGVVYSQNGKPGTSADLWQKALSLNEFYDVPSYNLFSLYRQNGLFNEARGMLLKCLNAKTVHFKERWESELKELDKHIELKKRVDDLNRQLNDAIRDGKLELVAPLREELIRITNPPKP